MCVSIVYADHVAEPYDADANTIRLPASLRASPHLALAGARAILTELIVPQPRVGAVCWCGEPLLLSAPDHTTQTYEVIHRGT